MLLSGLPLALLASFSLASSHAINDLLRLPAWGFTDLSPATKRDLESLIDKRWTGCQLACSTLSVLLPNEHSAVGQADYTPLPYWSIQQAEVVPACRIDVTSAKSISTVIKVSQLTQCPFTAKSGGHAAFAGASSVQDGILINLGGLNSVTVSTDRKTVSVGPGQPWSNVYNHLDPLGLSVVGGRDGTVGVGGFLLGGGISYFSGRYGWGCDNVKNYEVVLADGRIVNVSPTSYSDLYWALRGGGGSNFGIVSKFDLAAFEQGNIWGGGRYYSMDTNVSLANAFANFNVAAPTDPFAHLYIAFVYAAQLGGFAGISGPVYGKPEPNPPIFAELGAIPSLVDLTSVTSMSVLAGELGQSDYRRQLFKTVTFKNSATLFTEILKIYIEEASSILDVEGLLPALAFQPISKNIMEKMQQNGGNALGLGTDRGPLMIMNMNWGWIHTSDDARVQTATSNLINRSVALAKTMGLENPFIYMNYASLDAAVYEGYGKKNLKKLKAIKIKYDLFNVFGRLWKGYFKL